MSGPPRVTAIIVNWRTPEETIRSIASLQAAFPMNLRIVVVENGSRDDSPERLAAYVRANALEPYVSLLVSSENRGFCGGVNLGVARAIAGDSPPDFVWMLNPDAVVSPATLDELVAVALESGAQIVSPGRANTQYRHPKAWPQVFFLTPWAYNKRFDPARRWVEAGLYGGSCALFDVELVRKLISVDGHFLGEELFMDWDEWECTRRAARWGIRIALARDAAEDHPSEGRVFGSSRIAATRQYYQSRNAVVVARRHMPWWQFWPVMPLRLVRDASWFARLRLRGVQPNERAYVLGAVDAFRGRMGRWKHHPASPPASR